MVSKDGRKIVIGMEGEDGNGTEREDFSPKSFWRKL
jgi:hypothetical protein